MIKIALSQEIDCNMLATDLDFWNAVMRCPSIDDLPLQETLQLTAMACPSDLSRF